MCSYLNWELNVDDPMNSLPLYETVWVLIFIDTSSLLTTSKQQKKVPGCYHPARLIHTEGIQLMEHEMCFYLDWELNVDDPVNSLPLYEAVCVLFFINTSSLLTTSKQQKKCWAAIIVQGLFMLKEIN